MKSIVLLMTVLTLAVADCNQQVEKTIERTTTPALTELRNATYQGIEEQNPVTLKDGIWKGEPFVEGTASRPSVYLAHDFHVLGDLDGDGLEEAAVVLAANSAGTGENIYLAIIGIRDGQLRNLDTVLLGDRVQIRKAGIREGRLFMDVLQAGPEDAMCCPGELAVKAWSLKNDKLETMAAPSAPLRLSLDAITGPEWVLRWWNPDEEAAAKPEVTLSYAEGRFTGKSGCNSWFTAPVAGEQPGDLSVGPVGATKKLCPDEVMDVERRFHRQLEGVKKYGYMAGMLALTYETDGNHGVMLFEGRDPVKPE